MEVVRGETRLLTASGQGGCVKVFSLQSATYHKEPTEEKVTDKIMTDVFLFTHKVTNAGTTCCYGDGSCDLPEQRTVIYDKG